MESNKNRNNSNANNTSNTFTRSNSLLSPYINNVTNIIEKLNSEYSSLKLYLLFLIPVIILLIYFDIKNNFKNKNLEEFLLEQTIKYNYIGLIATIKNNVKYYFFITEIIKL